MKHGFRMVFFIAVLLWLLPAASFAAVETIEGTVLASECPTGEIVITDDTTLVMDADLTLGSIRGTHDLTIRDQGGHTLTITMPMSEYVITGNGAGHGISVNRLDCDASLKIKARKDGLNIDGDLICGGGALDIECGGDAVYSRSGDIRLTGIASAELKAAGSCIYSKNGSVKFDGASLQADSTGKSHVCIEGGYIDLKGDSIHAVSRADCIVSRSPEGMSLSGSVSAYGADASGAAFHARNGGSIHIAEGSVITASGSGSGLNAGGAVIMDGDGTLDVSVAHQSGICSGGNIVLRGSVKITAKQHAVYTPNGSLTVTGWLNAENNEGGSDCIRAKNVTLRCGTASPSQIWGATDAVAADGDLILSGDLAVYSNSGKASAVRTMNGGSVTIEDGDLLIVSKGAGINADGGIEMTAGTLTAKGGSSYALCARTGDISLHGTVSAESESGTAVTAALGRVVFSGALTCAAFEGGVFGKTGVFTAGSGNTLSVTSGKAGVSSTGPIRLEADSVSVTAKQGSAIFTGGDVTILADAELRGAGEKGAVYGDAVPAELSSLYGVFGDNVTLGGTMSVEGRFRGAFAQHDLKLSGDITARTTQGPDDAFYVFGRGDSHMDIVVTIYKSYAVACGGNMYLNGTVDAKISDTVTIGEFLTTYSVFDLAEPLAVVGSGEILIGSDQMILYPANGTLAADGKRIEGTAPRSRIGANPIEGTVDIGAATAAVGDDLFVWFGSEAEYDGLVYTWESTASPASGSAAAIGKENFYVVRAKDTGKYIRCRVTSAHTTGAQYSGWCYVLPREALSGGVVYTSGARYTNPISSLTTARTGVLGDIERVSPETVHFQWQKSPDGESGWQDISVSKNSSAKSSALRITGDEVGSFLRLIATVDGMTGSVVSSPKFVAKLQGTGVPSNPPALTTAEPYTSVTVTNAQLTQEYLLTETPYAPTDWSKAVVPASAGNLSLPCAAGKLWYVHTRIRGSAVTEPGERSVSGAIYTGSAAVTQHPEKLTFDKTSIVTKAGGVTQLTVRPLPADFEGWNDYKVRWYVNGSAAALFSESSCTIPLTGALTTQHTVYVKGLTAVRNVDVGCEVSVGAGGTLIAMCGVRIADADGSHMLDALQFRDVDLFPGETVIAPFTASPAGAKVGTLSFEKRTGVDDPGDLTLTDLHDGTISVAAPEGLEPGLYLYEVKVDGASTYRSSVIRIRLLPQQATVLFDSGGAELLGDGAGLMEAVMAPQTVPLGAEFILPENGFDVPEGWAFDGWDKGESGDGINVTEDVTVTAKWKTHTHSMTRFAETASLCTAPGHMEYYYCDGCGKYYGDEAGLYPTDIALLMKPALGHTPAAEAAKENETAPTCALEGGYDMVTRCTVCGEAVSSVHTTLSALGHVPGEAARENESAPTCTENGGYEDVTRCTACGEELSRTPGVIPHTGHSLTHVAAKEPTDSADGNLEHYVCEICGALFKDAAGEQEIPDFHDVVLDALGGEEPKNAESYVERAYSVILGRAGDEEGVAHWVSELSGGASAGEIVKEFFRSAEYAGRGLTAAQTVDLCYRSMLDRAPDEEGLSNWTALLEDGYSTTKLVAEFVSSPEFGGICAEYGLTAGTIALSERDQNSNITRFVERCYTFALERAADEAGLNEWCAHLLNKDLDPERVAFGFVFSDESKAMARSDTDFISMLYRLMLDRDPDADGLANWVSALEQNTAAEIAYDAAFETGRSEADAIDQTRQDIYALFAASEEFALMCANFGL